MNSSDKSVLFPTESVERAERLVSSIGILPRDEDRDFISPLRFRDGGWYKWEVAGAFDAESVISLAQRLERDGVRLHQVTNTVGTMRYLDIEIRDLVVACADLGIQLRMSVGPRGVFDIGGQHLASSEVAAASSYRLRGNAMLVRAVDDVLHAMDCGVKGFLIFDEGLLWVLNHLKQNGDIPEQTYFKASSNMGAQNAAHAKMLEENGADSVNFQRDLSVSMLAAARRSLHCAFDLHTDNPRQTGGFVRGYDVPNMVRVAAPVYLKTGNAAQNFSLAAPDAAQIEAIAHQVLLDNQMINRFGKGLAPSDTPEF